MCFLLQKYLSIFFALENIGTNMGCLILLSMRCSFLITSWRFDWRFADGWFDWSHYGLIEMHESLNRSGTNPPESGCRPGLANALPDVWLEARSSPQDVRGVCHPPSRFPLEKSETTSLELMCWIGWKDWKLIADKVLLYMSQWLKAEKLLQYNIRLFESSTLT